MSFERYSSGGLLTGAASGAALSALLSWLSNRKDKKQSLLKKLVKTLGWTVAGGLAGGAAGAYLGRMLYRHKNYNQIRKKVDDELGPDDRGKVNGRVFYIDTDKNVHMPSEKDTSASAAIARKLFPGGVPIGHGMMATVDEKTGDVKVFSIGQAGIGRKDLANEKGWEFIRQGLSANDAEKTIDGMKKLLASSKTPLPRLDIMEYKGLGKLDDKSIAEFIGKKMKEKGYGDSVTFYEGDKNIDIRRPQKFFLKNFLSALGKGGGGFSAMPGGFNCGVSAREAFDAFQPRTTAAEKAQRTESPDPSRRLEDFRRDWGWRWSGNNAVKKSTDRDFIDPWESLEKM